MSDLTERLAVVLTKHPAPWSWEYGVSLRTAWGLLDGKENYILRFGQGNDISICPDAELVLELIELVPFIELELLRARLDEYRNFVWPHDGYGTTQAVQEARQKRIAELKRALKEESRDL